MGIRNNEIEVLCPAGDLESVVAAVTNGANAVYLGMKDFSARQSAKNFDYHDLREAIAYCHARGVFVYLAFNTIVFDNQLEEAKKAIAIGCELGVDAFIVQDLGVMSLLQKMCPTMPIHASTQMAVHTVKGAQLLKEQGVTRVVLARELTLSEIQEIASSVDIETEVFVHGALCMSVSGQCYMSGMIGTRSGNRGSCAGTCRLPFTSNGKPGYDLSLKDNCLVSYVGQLKAAGVTSLKIEGRMKRPEYVAAAARAYHNAVFGETNDIDTLQAVFSRSGFTDGYLIGKADSAMFGYRQKEDVIAATNQVLKSLQNTYKKERACVGVDFHFIAHENEPISLTVKDDDGNQVTVTANPPEIAQKTPMTQESVERSLSKLGGTPFYLQNLTTDFWEGLIVSTSALNELRRNACEQLYQMRAQIKPVPCHADVAISLEKSKPSSLAYRARFATVEQIPFAMMDMFQYVILPIDEVMKHRENLVSIQDKIIIEPYRVMFLSEQNQIEKLKVLKQQGYHRLLADNLAHIQIGKELGFTIHAGAYLNCVNSYSAKQLADFGVTDITLSFEAELKKINAMIAERPLGIIVYGYIPLMIMKNCPIKAKHKCKDCNGTKALVDRKGVAFRVICNHRKYSEVLNSNPLYMADRMKELRNCSFATLYFTIETQAQVERVIRQYQNGDAPKGEFTRGLYYRSI